MLGKPHGNYKGSLCAFTLVEFMSAIVLSMILSVIAIAGFRVYERELPVRLAARRLSQTCAAARAYALANNSTYTVQISRQFGNVWIDETDDFGTPIVPKVCSPEALDKKVRLEAIDYGAAGLATGPTAGVRFYKEGNSDDVSVYLRMVGKSAADTANLYTVRIYGPTGQSRVFERQRLAPALR